MGEMFRRFLIHFFTTTIRGLTKHENKVHSLSGTGITVTSGSGVLTIVANDYATVTDDQSLTPQGSKIRQKITQTYEWYKRIADEYKRFDAITKLISWLVAILVVMLSNIRDFIASYNYDFSQEVRNFASTVWHIIEKSYLTKMLWHLHHHTPFYYGSYQQQHNVL